MRIPIRLPDLGASGAAFSLWYAQPGETLFEGERIAEVLLACATFDVDAPVAGQLAERVVQPGDMLESGQVLGWIDAPEESG